MGKDKGSLQRMDQFAGEGDAAPFTDRAFLIRDFDPGMRAPWAVEDGIYGDEKIWRHASCIEESMRPGSRRIVVRTYAHPVSSVKVMERAFRDGLRVATLEEACALIDYERIVIRDHKDWIIPLGSAYHHDDDPRPVLMVLGELRSAPGKLIGTRMICDGDWPARDVRLHFVLVEDETVSVRREPPLLEQGKDYIDVEFRVIEEAIARS